MTVAQLIEELARFPKDMLIQIDRGQDFGGVVDIQVISEEQDRPEGGPDRVTLWGFANDGGCP